MSERPFRFVHASDLHLERPLAGVTEVPEHLRELFLDAPYSAARKLFDRALHDEVDFVVLAGDIADLDLAGPRAALFMLEQFERLAAKQIAVYWACGPLDAPEQWPLAGPLPDNVHVFSRLRTEEYTHQREGRAVAHLVGLSQDRWRPVRAADFWPDPTGLFTVAVTYGEADVSALGPRGVAYWALGGEHAPATPLAAPCIVRYPGTPQGRAPDEPAAHGATLVEVVKGVPPRVTHVPLDGVRWETITLSIDTSTRREHLERLLEARLDETRHRHVGADLLVSWRLQGSGPLAAQLRVGKLGDELLAQLRKAHGQRSPAAWSVSLELDSDAPLPPLLYDQQTILGEFLRAVREHQAADGARDLDELNLQPYLSERHMAGTLAGDVRLDAPAARQRILQRAAVLGADLLGGEEADL